MVSITLTGKSRAATMDEEESSSARREREFVLCKPSSPAYEFIHLVFFSKRFMESGYSIS
jgi:hypothetical protein